MGIVLLSALLHAGWSVAIKDSRNPAEFEEYLKRYPDGVFSGLARIRLAELK